MCDGIYVCVCVCHGNKSMPLRCSCDIYKIFIGIPKHKALSSHSPVCTHYTCIRMELELVVWKFISV